MSVIDTGGLDALASASHRLFSLADRRLDGTGIQRFRATGSYYDFGHYMERLAAPAIEGGNPEVRDAYENVVRALEETVVYSAATPWLWEGRDWESVKIDHHCGLSSYIVSYKGGEYVSGYNRLQWWRDAASGLAL